jgi:hypothetical protein
VQGLPDAHGVVGGVLRDAAAALAPLVLHAEDERGGVPRALAPEERAVPPLRARPPAVHPEQPACGVYVV